MSKSEDVARMKYVIENYDKAELVTNEDTGEIDYSAEFRDKNDNPAKLVKLSKQINGAHYVVITAADNKYKKLWVVSTYIKKRVTQTLDATAPSGDVQNASASPLSNSISPNSRNDNIILNQDRDYSYDELIKKPNMTVPHIKRDYRNLTITKCIETILEDLKKEKDTVTRKNNTAVKCNDTNDYVLVTRESLRHGIVNDKTGATRLVSANIAIAIRNGIKVNIAEGKRNNADSAYVLMGKMYKRNGNKLEAYYYRMVVNRYEENNNGEYYIDNLYAMKAKKEDAFAPSAPRVTAKADASNTSSKLKVSDFLNEVKDYYGDALSEDVNNHFGRTRGKSDIDGLRYHERTTPKTYDEALIGNLFYFD